jgi:proteic killer suppression protein
MINSFGSKETAKIWNGVTSAKLSPEIQQIARRKLRMLNNSVDLKDLMIPPSNRLERLTGKLNHSGLKIQRFDKKVKNEIF